MQKVPNLLHRKNNSHTMKKKIGWSMLIFLGLLIIYAQIYINWWATLITYSIIGLALLAMHLITSDKNNTHTTNEL